MRTLTFAHTSKRTIVRMMQLRLIALRLVSSCWRMRISVSKDGGKCVCWCEAAVIKKFSAMEDVTSSEILLILQVQLEIQTLSLARIYEWYVQLGEGRNILTSKYVYEYSGIHFHTSKYLKSSANHVWWPVNKCVTLRQRGNNYLRAPTFQIKFLQGGWLYRWCLIRNQKIISLLKTSKASWNGAIKVQQRAKLCLQPERYWDISSRKMYGVIYVIFWSKKAQSLTSILPNFSRVPC